MQTDAIMDFIEFSETLMLFRYCIDAKNEICIFTMVLIAKVTSQEVRRKRVGGSLGAPQISAQLLKPLFLKLLATFQNDRMNAIINVHETSVCVTSGEQ